MPRFFGFLLVVFFLSVPVSAKSGSNTETVNFDVFMLGIKVAELRLATKETANRYAFTGQLKTTGLAGALARVRFEMTTIGVKSPKGLMPRQYKESMDTGRRISNADMTILDHPRRVQMFETRIDTAPDRFIDPLTALHLALQDRPQAPLCDLNTVVFDGTRQSHVRLTPGADASCKGLFRRVAGYSAAELEERSTFPFTLYFSQRDGIWRVDRAKLRSLYGPILLKRR